MSIDVHLAPTLFTTYIKLPTSVVEVEHLTSGFFNHHGFPQCIGAVDGTHIFIRQPSVNPTDFLNRKNRYSYNVQAVCDFCHCFIDVVIRWPGSVHDARIFTNSKINSMLKDGTVPPCLKNIVDGEDSVPICLLGDPAYQLLPHVLKEYPAGGSTLEERFFCQRLSSARIAIECAFGRLKARFGALRREMDLCHKDLPNVIYTCFVLHSFCQSKNEQLADEAVQNAVQYDSELQPAVRRERGSQNETEGKRIRNIFKAFFNNR